MWLSTGGSDSSCTEEVGPRSAGTPGGCPAESPSPNPLCPWGGTQGGAGIQGSKPCPCPLSPGPLSPGAWMSGHAVSKALRAEGMTWRLGWNVGNGEQCQRYHRWSRVCCPASHPKRGSSGLLLPGQGWLAHLTWTLAWSLQHLPFLLHHCPHAPLSLV